jgi:hypothetical protein
MQQGMPMRRAFVFCVLLAAACHTSMAALALDNGPFPVDSTRALQIAESFRLVEQRQGTWHFDSLYRLTSVVEDSSGFMVRFDQTTDEVFGNDFGGPLFVHVERSRPCAKAWYPRGIGIYTLGRKC